MPDFVKSWGIALLGWGAAAALMTMYIGAKADIKAEIERCNTEKVIAIQEATEALRTVEMASYKARILELEQLALDESNARLIAQQAAIEAQNRPERVRTVIKEVASANACIDTVVPAAVLDSLRD